VPEKGQDLAPVLSAPEHEQRGRTLNALQAGAPVRHPSNGWGHARILRRCCWSALSGVWRRLACSLLMAQP